MKRLQNTFNPVKPTVENTLVFKPNHVCDEVRKQFFTTFDVKLLNRLREIKLNNLNKK